MRILEIGADPKDSDKALIGTLLAEEYSALLVAYPQNAAASSKSIVCASIEYCLNSHLSKGRCAHQTWLDSDVKCYIRKRRQTGGSRRRSGRSRREDLPETIEFCMH